MGPLGPGETRGPSNGLQVHRPGRVGLQLPALGPRACPAGAHGRTENGSRATEDRPPPAWTAEDGQSQRCMAKSLGIESLHFYLRPWSLNRIKRELKTRGATSLTGEFVKQMAVSNVLQAVILASMDPGATLMFPGVYVKAPVGVPPSKGSPASRKTIKSGHQKRATAP